MKTFFAFLLMTFVCVTNAYSQKSDNYLPFGEKPQTSTSQKTFSKVRVTVLGEDSLDVPYVTHIPSFSVFVNILEDKSVVVTERLVLVLSEPQNGPFVRSYPLSYTDTLGKIQESKIEFVWASYNKKEVTPRINKTDTNIQLRFFEREGLAKGVHLFEVSYIVSDAVLQQGNITSLFLPLLGSDLVYPSERVQILVAYPPQTTLSKAQLVFGTNNQINEDAYDGYTDEANHLVYKIKRILPEYVDIRLDLVGDAKGFSAIHADEKIDKTLNVFGWIIVALLCIVVMFLYFHFTALDVKDNMQNNKVLSKMRSKFSYDIGMLRWVYMRKADTKTLFAMIIHLLQKGLLAVRFDENEQIILVRGENTKSNFYEKNILSFIFGGLKKERKLSTWIFNEKVLKIFRKLVLKNIYRQKMLLVRREILIGALLPLIAVVLSVYLSYNIYQISAELIVILVAYMLCVNHFIRKGKLDILMRQLFEEYTEHSLSEAKQRELDIALEKDSYANDVALLIMLKGRRLPLGEFEKMFFAQIRA